MKLGWTRGALGLVLLAAPSSTAIIAADPSAPAGEVGAEASGPSGTAAADEATGPEEETAPSNDSRDARVYLLDRLAAGASLGYFTSDQTRILSRMHFDFPFFVVRQKSLYVRGSIETSTVKTGPRLRTDSFQAQDIEYLVEAGARDYLSNRLAIAAFFGQQGLELLDQAGSSSIRYAGLGFESVGFPRPGGPDRFEWRLWLGPVIGSKGVDADAVLHGAILYDAWRRDRSSIGIDASFDSLFDDLSGQTEYRVGPRWTFPLPNGIRASLFAEWIRGRNPLQQFGAQGWNLGFRYTEGAYSGPHTAPAPDVRGVLTFGRGRSRGHGRFDLDLSSPEIRLFSRPSRVFANLDANIIGGTGTDNLFYIATAGVEVQARRWLLVGPHFYHRSNHTIGQGPTVPNSVNVVQISLRTPGWEYLNRLPGQLIPGPDENWRDRLEASLAPGIVTGSTFKDARSWNLQAGFRQDIGRRSDTVVPFLRLFSEWGEATRRELSFGVSTRQNLVIEVLYRKDTHYFGLDRTDVFLAGSLFF